MKKIKLIAVSKHNNHDGYILSKEQGIFEMVRQIIKSTRKDEWYWNCFGRPEGKDHEPDFKREDDIKTWTDSRTVFNGEGWWIEVVIGKSKVFLTFYGKKPLRDKFAKIVLKFAEMKEPKRRKRKTRKKNA